MTQSSSSRASRRPRVASAVPTTHAYRQNWLPDCDPSQDQNQAFVFWAMQPQFVTITDWNARVWALV